MNGLITDAARRVAEGARDHGWFDLSTLREPYRVEGKKTMGYELFEQLGGRLPDVIIYPTGGGTGLVGMWKAFDEMERLGWIGPERPAMISVQAAGCAPIVRAWDAGARPRSRGRTRIPTPPGFGVPRAIGDFLILRAVRQSGGAAVAVPDEAMRGGSSRGQDHRHLRRPRAAPRPPRSLSCSSAVSCAGTRRSSCSTRAAASSTSGRDAQP